MLWQFFTGKEIFYLLLMIFSVRLKNSEKAIIMTSYQTYLTLDDSQVIVLCNLPFQEGTKLAINIQVVEDESSEVNPKVPLNTLANFETLLDSTQGI